VRRDPSEPLAGIGGSASMQAAAGSCAIGLPLRAADQASSGVQTSRSECRFRTDAATPLRRRDHGSPRYPFCSWSTATGAIAMAAKEASAGASFGDSYATNAIAGSPTSRTTPLGDAALVRFGLDSGRVDDRSCPEGAVRATRRTV